MSIIKKRICEKCNKELHRTEWYYECRISCKNDSCDNAESICFGDYCRNCLKEIVIKNLEIKRSDINE